LLRSLGRAEKSPLRPAHEIVDKVVDKVVDEVVDEVVAVHQNFFRE
jgi:hypothetical protein